jgi:hypothetical protein
MMSFGVKILLLGVVSIAAGYFIGAISGYWVYGKWDWPWDLFKDGF